MPHFLKKNLMKWSTIAVLGLSAYFLGYFWSLRRAEILDRQQLRASAKDVLDQSTETSLLK